MLFTIMFSVSTAVKIVLLDHSSGVAKAYLWAACCNLIPRSRWQTWTIILKCLQILTL